MYQPPVKASQGNVFRESYSDLANAHNVKCHRLHITVYLLLELSIRIRGAALHVDQNAWARFETHNTVLQSMLDFYKTSMV